MKRTEFDVLSETTNCPVILMHGRKYPGLLFQGDSVSIIRQDLKELCELIENPEEPRESALDLAQAIHDTFVTYLLEYQNALAVHGIDLPYTNPVKEADILVTEGQMDD